VDATVGATVGVNVRVSNGIEMVGIGVGVDVAVGAGVGEGERVGVGDAVNVGVKGTAVIGSACASGAPQPHNSPNTIHP